MSPFDFLFKMKKRKRKGLLGKRQGEEGVLEDGARLLKEVIASCDGRDCYPIQMFSAKEIEQAIKEPCNDGPHFGYLGIYQDRPIYIKRYDHYQREEAFNEIVFLAQIKHTNVVKLMGCCFEMEQPISILEHVPYSLSNHLFEANPSSASPTSWDHRLRIAIEIAYAITYLHIGTSRPIVHRYINCSNILLDEQFKPKLADFSLSVTIPVGETHVEVDRIVGKYGYMDGEYMMHGYVSEKTDVYSYGVVLFELLSGKKRISLEGDYLDLLVSDSIHKEITDKEKALKLILGNGLSMNVNQVEQAMACMELAGRCITDNRDEWPSMKDVTKQLWQIERGELPPPSFLHREILAGLWSLFIGRLVLIGVFRRKLLKQWC